VEDGPIGLRIGNFWGQPFWCLLHISLALGVSVTISCDRALAQIPIPPTLPPKPPEPIPIPQPAPETPLQPSTPALPSQKERLGIPDTVLLCQWVGAKSSELND
jgi:hypothetical protein